MRHNRRSSWICNSISIACIFVLTFLAIGFSPVQGENTSDTWKLVSQIGGNTQAIAVSGDITWAGIGLSLTSVDISDPSAPKMLGKSAPFTDTIQDIFIQGKTAFVAAGSAGLQIVDITNPAQPNILASIQSASFAEGIAVLGKTAYLANGATGINIIDVSDPKKPLQISTVNPDYYAFDIVCAGKYAYIAAGESGLLVLDIKDPSQPKEIAQLDTKGYAYEVVQSIRNLYIADAWEGVQVVDITNPAKPVLTTSIPTTGWSLGVSLSGKQLVSANGSQGFDLFDVSDPKKPVLQSTYLKEPSDGDTSIRRTVISGNAVFTADTVNGVRIVDITDPQTPTQLGLFSQLSYARRLTLNGDYAYVATANEGSMAVVNIADPLQPYQVSKFQADGISIDVVVNNNYATLGTFEDMSNCYTLIDISDPAKPTLSDAIDLQSLLCGAPRQMAAQGNFVYSADEYGLSIYDLSDPGKITTASRIELQLEGHQTLAISVSGNYAYVGDAGAGLKIVDISDPANPKFITAYNYENTGSIFSTEDILFIGHYGEGISTAANSKPGTKPTFLGNYKTIGSVEETYVEDNLLIASEGSGGLEILDVSDPANLKLVQAVETPGFAWASVFSGDYLYTADGAAGVLIFKKQTGDQQPSSSKTPNYPMIEVNSIIKGDETQSPNYPPLDKKAKSTKVCTVNAKSDSGPGSLRECLTNITAGESILFDPKVFPPKAPVTIALSSPLPTLEVGSITIDASNAGVTLDGQQQVPTGFRIASSYNTIMGIEFINFPMDGITLEFPGEYNQIGGDHSIGEGPSGQGNTFSGCQNGMRLLFTRNNTIKGNFIGTNAGGTKAAQQNHFGIAVSSFATNNWIGGPSVGEKNIIGNNYVGIDIASNSAVFNKVAGNFVGTDITGTIAIPNDSWGVLIEVGGRNNTIGGTTEEERNIISGNNMGVCISDYASTQNSIIGNYIGLDVSGTKPLPNQSGLCIFQSSYNRIGGTQPGEQNNISANSGAGVRFFGAGSIQAILMGNIIGQENLGNSNGLLIDGGTHSMVGGVSELSSNTFSDNQTAVRIEYAGTNFNWLAGNLITGSSQSAVLIENHANNNYFEKNTIKDNEIGVTNLQSIGNTLHANMISGNTVIGIENRNEGNLELAAPVLTEVTSNKISGSACPGCLIEVFSDPSNQGLVYEGMTLADASGNFIYTGEVTGPNVTATATDLMGNTSAFSIASKVK